MRAFLLIVTSLSLVLVVGVIGFHSELAALGGPFEALHYLEKDAPELEVSMESGGIGIQPTQLRITAADPVSGLDEIIVRALQEGREIEILKKTYQRGVNKDSFEVAIDGEKLGILEGRGKVTISVAAFDKGFFSNAAKSELSVPVDYQRPEVEVLTVQHNGAMGGVQLLLYTLADNDSETVSGIQFGERFFTGGKALLLDSAFESRPDIYYVLFGFPRDASGGERPKLTARDGVGNSISKGFSYRMRDRSFKDDKIKVSDDYITDKVLTLATSFSDSNLAGAPESVPQEKTEIFRLVNENYRQTNIDTIKKLLKGKPTPRKWEGAFMRMSGGALQAGFGEKREYFYGDSLVGGSLHEGMDLASRSRSPVQAANHGVVVWAGDLGVYGKTVIIDHGTGVASLYAHLSEITVSTGSEISKNDKIGLSGESGLAGGDHLHFEIRVDGEAVHPIEWWDERWIKDHITLKVADVKSFVGVGRVLN